MASGEFKQVMLAHGTDVDKQRETQKIANADMAKHYEAVRRLKVGQRVRYQPPDGYRPYGIKPGLATVVALRSSKADIRVEYSGGANGFTFDVHAGYLQDVEPDEPEPGQKS